MQAGADYQESCSEGRVEDAEEGVAGLKPLDNQEANYWMAVVCAMKRNQPDGFKLATQLLENVRRSALCVYIVYHVV